MGYMRRKSKSPKIQRKDDDLKKLLWEPEKNLETV